MQPARVFAPEAGRVHPPLHDWQSLHIFIHDFGQIGLFLRDCLAQMPAELSADTFFIRYWYGGPHIRLRFAGAERTDPIMAWLQHGLKACPDSAPLLPAEHYRAYQPYLASEMAEANAGASNHSTAAPAWYAHGSVQAIAYTPEVARYGGPVGLALAEQHFVWDSHAALKLLEWVADGPAAQVEKLMLGYCFEHVAAWQRATECPISDAVQLVLQAGPPVGDAKRPQRPPRPPRPPLPASSWALQQACERWQARQYFPRQLNPLAGQLSSLVTAMTQGGVHDIPSVMNSLLHMSFNRCGVAPQREKTIRRCAADSFSNTHAQGADHD